MVTPRVVVVGGGLAGSAAALRLARAGVAVTLLEREAEPGLKVCGEFLSADAMAELDDLGIDVRRLGARAVRRLSLSAGGRVADGTLPFAAVGVERRRLDGALLAAAASAGADVRRGTAVRGIGRASGRPAARTDAGPVDGDLVVLATGKHDLRAMSRPSPAPGRSMLGLKMPVRLPGRAMDDLDGTIALHLFDGGYAGLVGVGDGVANLCLAVSTDAFAAAGSSLEGIVRRIAPPSSPIGARLAGWVPLEDRPAAVGRIPYGWRCWRSDGDGDGIWRVGDQAAVTPSLTGDGMAIALVSARLAAQTILARGERTDYHAALARAVGGQMRVAGLLDTALARRSLARAAVGIARRAPGLVRAVSAATRLG
jgi:flavin-dependent dehydrogenase